MENHQQNQQKRTRGEEWEVEEETKTNCDSLSTHQVLRHYWSFTCIIPSSPYSKHMSQILQSLYNK